MATPQTADPSTLEALWPSDLFTEGVEVVAGGELGVGAEVVRGFPEVGFRFGEVVHSEWNLVYGLNAMESCSAKILEEGAEAFRENAGWIKDATGRIVDLLEPFRSFHFYAPEQHGSVSLKAVLPVLTGRGYTDLQIQNGTTASLAFMRIAFTNVADEERRRIRRHLEDYCWLDTSGMDEIVEALRRLVAGGLT